MYDTETEAIFRERESRLDSLVSAISEKLHAVGVSFKDTSNRKRLDIGFSYGKLWWGAAFTKQWHQGSKKFFAELRLSYQESFGSGQSQIIYVSVYVGSGSPINISSRLALNEVEYILLPPIKVDDLDEQKFLNFIISTIEQVSYVPINKP